MGTGDTPGHRCPGPAKAKAVLRGACLVAAMLGVLDACALGVPARRRDLRRRYPVHTVGPDETVYSIARAHDVDVRALIELNDLREPDTIHAGQDLLIPIDAEGGPPPRPERRSVRRRPSRAVDDRPRPSSCRAAARGGETGAGLLWPATGRAYRLPSDAADPQRAVTEVGAAPGTPVWAAADGVVTFSGPRAGYGRLVAIRHEARSVSTQYSGALQLCVQTGARVRRGQVVALLERMADRDRARLTFEVLPLPRHSSTRRRPLERLGR